MRYRKGMSNTTAHPLEKTNAGDKAHSFHIEDVKHQTEAVPTKSYNDYRVAQVNQPVKSARVEAWRGEVTDEDSRRFLARLSVEAAQGLGMIPARNISREDIVEGAEEAYRTFVRLVRQQVPPLSCVLEQPEAFGGAS